MGTVATTMAGGTFGAASSLSGGGNIFTRSEGGEVVVVHGPSGSCAWYHSTPLDR